MRQRIIIKIDDREITVKELTVREILDQVNGLEAQGDLFESFRPMFEKTVEGLAFEDLKQLAPSEIEQIWGAFKKANAPFFKALAWTGLDKALQEIREQFVTELSGRFLSSLKPVMPGFTNTAGPGSSMHGTPINGF